MARDWAYRAGAEHHEACDLGGPGWDEDFAPEPEPFVSVDHYHTCGHKLACTRCGNTSLTVVTVPGGYWTGALCEPCGILECIHSG